jgi:hypothetical protein
MPNVPPPHARRAALISISMASDSTMWAVDANQQALHHTGNGNFGPVGDRAMSKISVGSNAQDWGPWGWAQVWGVDSSGQAVGLQPATSGSSWQNLDYGQIKLITIDGTADNTVWGIDRDNNPVRWIPSANSWEWPGGVGTPTSVKATQIAVGRRDFVCCINLDGRVQRWDYMGIHWQPPLPALPPLSGGGDNPAISVALGRLGVLWAIGIDQLVYQLASTGDAWLHTGWGPLKQISGGDSYHLAGLAPTRADRDGHPSNDFWVSNFGPLRVPLDTLPPPPRVVEFHSPAVKVIGPTRNAPALAAFNREVCAAYQNDNQDHMFCFRASSNRGASWRSDGGYQPGVGTPAITNGIGGAPALAVLNGALHCAYQANDPSNLLYVTRTYDGAVWMSPRQVHVTPNGDANLTLRVPGQRPFAVRDQFRRR